MARPLAEASVTASREASRGAAPGPPPAEPPPAPPRVLRGAVYVPVRKALHELKTRNGLKGFALYGAFFALYFGLGAWQFNTREGFATIEWIQLAVQEQYDLVSSDDNAWCDVHGGLACHKPFEELGTVAELIVLLREDFSKMIDAVYEYCPACLVGMSALDSDFEPHTQAHFFCVDFELEHEANNYARRDCEAADAAWRAGPSVHAVPCCEQPELRVASVAMRVLHARRGQRAAQLAFLLDPQNVEQALRAYIEGVLDDAEGGGRAEGRWGTLAQLMVQRDAHFVGGLYRARYRNRAWLPGRVETALRYSTERHDRPAEYWVLLAATLLAWALSAAHSAQDVLARRRAGRPLARVLLAPKFLLLELPSLAAPYLMLLLPNVHAVSAREHVLGVSVIQLFLFSRLLVDGQHLPPLRLIVRTLMRASGQLALFTLAMLMTLAVSAGLHMQLFGAFDARHAGFGSALTEQFSVMLGGSALSEASLRLAPVEAYLMHYVTNLFLFLILAQFFIAILVGAFDATREAEARRLERALPPGLQQREEGRALSARAGWTVAQRAAAAAGFVLAYRVHGTFGWRLRRELHEALEAAEARRRRLDEATGGAALGARGVDGRRAMLFTRAQLQAAVGAEAADGLEREFGVVALRDDDEALAHFLAPEPGGGAAPTLAPLADSSHSTKAAGAAGAAARGRV